MASIINADSGISSSVTGITFSADNSGALNIQTNGVTAIAISSSQAVSFPATTSLNFGSANITTLTSSSATITNLIATTLTVSGVAVFPAGTATLPSITTTGDLNTGIYFPAADQVALTTGGTQRFLVNASGNVGIGTTTLTTARLNVVGTGNANSIMTETAAFIGTSANGLFIGSDSADTMMGVNNSGTNLTLLSRAGGVYSKALTIDSAGNIGVGVTPSSSWPSNWKALQINANGLGTYAVANQIGFFQNAIFNGSNWVYAASQSAARYAVDTGTHVWTIASSGTAGNSITFNEAARISDSPSGGVFTVGTQGSVARIGTDYATVGMWGSNGGGIRIYRGSGAGTSNSYIYGDSTGFFVAAVESVPMLFYTGNSERARITSGGVFQVNTTSSSYGGAQARCDINGGGTAALVTTTSGGASYAVLYCHNTATSGDNVFIDFGTEATWTSRGSITYNRSGGLVAYNTTSDYRAKDVFGPLVDSGNTIDALKVYTGKMKDATVERPMLIAHEAQEVAPYAVTGEKDAVNEDGTPKYQQIDHASLVPLLIAEIQSLRARVAALEGV